MFVMPLIFYRSWRIDFLRVSFAGATSCFYSLQLYSQKTHFWLGKNNKLNTRGIWIPDTWRETTAHKLNLKCSNVLVLSQCKITSAYEGLRSSGNHKVNQTHLAISIFFTPISLTNKWWHCPKGLWICGTGTF